MNVELTEYPYFAGTAMTPDLALLDRLATEHVARGRAATANAMMTVWLRASIVGLTDGRPITLPTFASPS